MKRLITCSLLWAGVLSGPAGQSSPEKISQEPTVAQRITLAKVFAEPIVWVGAEEPALSDSQALWEALEVVKKAAVRKGVAALEEFVVAHPGSPWVPSLLGNLGVCRQESLDYTGALAFWARAWEDTRHYHDGTGQRVADFALSHWARLLAGLGRMDELEGVLSQAQGRVPRDLGLRRSLGQSRRALADMKKNPHNFKCGTLALAHLAAALRSPNLALQDLQCLPSPTNGFSLSMLHRLSMGFGLRLEPVRRPDGGELVVPCVVHWREDHFATVTARKGNRYQVLDPIFPRPKWLEAEAINRAASGYFLIPRGTRPPTWQTPSAREADAVLGKGLDTLDPQPAPPPCPEDNQEACDCEGSGALPSAGFGPGHQPGSSCPSCRVPSPAVLASGSGLPTWEVNEPYISLWLRDEPLRYRPSRGRDFAVRLYYHEHEERLWSTNIFNFGPHWNCNLLSYLVLSDENDSTTFTNYYATLYGSGGGQRSYDYASTNAEKHTATRLERMVVGGTLSGFKVVYRNGSEAIYGLFRSVSTAPNLTNQAFLTRQIDAQGYTTQFFYSTNNDSFLLTHVVDADGLTNWIRYHDTFTSQVDEIEDRFGHKVSFAYDAEGVMTNLTDVLGLSSSFTYQKLDDDPSDYYLLTTLTNGYGATTFDYSSPLGHLYGEVSETDDINRAITVTEAGGEKHLYMYRDYCETLLRGGQERTFLAEAYADVPDYVPVNPLVVASPGLGNRNMYYRNSYYWGPRQYSSLSTTNIFQLSTNDYLRGRLRNWLHEYMVFYAVTHVLNMEQLPSPDGTAPGQKMWLGYAGKGNWNVESSTNNKPAYVAWRLPDGGTRYTYTEYNPLGYATKTVTTNISGTVHALLTNTFTYAANGIDLVVVTNSGGVRVLGRGYNSAHQVLVETNAVGEVTTLTYDANGLLTSLRRPSGLTTTNLYDGDGRLEKTIDLEIARTNAFTYTNGWVRTQTDERGLTKTYSWDALGRPTQVSFPDSTSITYGYDKLDLAEVVDRLGFTNRYAYNALQQMTSWINGNGATNRYVYCDCGPLTYMTNALGQVTEFAYDDQGRLLRTYYPDGSGVTNEYDGLGQVTKVSDASGVVTNWYNNYGLLTAVSNHFGQLRGVGYDPLDHPTNVVDGDGVVTSQTFDSLGRLTKSIYAGSGTNTFGYSSNGLVASTNALHKVTWYTNDVAGRRTHERDANTNTTLFEYTAAGDLSKINSTQADHSTMWYYDVYGRVSRKEDDVGNTNFVYQYDANGRLTNRWSAAKGNTGYSYDKVGNLTNVNYANSLDLQFSYDVGNRLTGMVDAAGTSAYTYTGRGAVASEDGPWGNDTVTYTYNGLQRKSLSLTQPNASAWGQSYSYDAAARLDRIDSPLGAFSYTYHPDRHLQVARIALPNTAYVTNIYDSLARLTETGLNNSGHAPLNWHGYVYNDGNQRTSQTFFNDNYTSYTYDPIGQLRTAVGKEAGGTTNRWHEQFQYTYDLFGNLTNRNQNGFVQSFTVNTLDQLTGASRSGPLTVAGTTTSAATNVTVNTSNAFLYADYTFASTNHSLVNGTNTFTAVAQDSLGRVDTNVATVYLPESISYTYDDNGNLLTDGRRYFAWDDENQLIQVILTNALKSNFVYDGKGRRRVRTEAAWNGTGWLTNAIVWYVYDGNLVLQERDGSNVPRVTYTRGRDLSGSLEGAGGIGGLLARTDHGTGETAFYHADGNGNITALVNAQQVIVARYHYDPFGNILSLSGPLAAANLYRFSSKELHEASGLIYYLYRYYDPNLQRWPNRDPVTEGGFQFLRAVAGGKSRAEQNLFAFVHNTPINKRDAWGLVTIPGLPAVPGVDVTICPSFGGSDVDIHYCIVFHKPTPFPGSLCEWFKCAVQAYGNLAKACLKGDDADWDEACHGLDLCFKYFW